jgi:gamma-glutamyltranspeptidase/glutathione hydrolase
MTAAQVAYGTRFAVASGHAAATQAALAVLEDGGNAVDAAIAGAAVLAVVLPYACGLGGDVFALIHDTRSGRTSVLNGSGRAPGATRPDGEIPRTGPGASTVPGMPRGWQAALERFGTRPLAALLGPAIRLAGEGFPAHRCHVENTAGRAALLARDGAAASIFLPGGKPPDEGSLVRQPDLARTLETMAQGGAAAFYGGPLAARFGAHFTGDDLARQDVVWQEPIGVPYGGTEILTAPPNSWGVAVLLQLLALGEQIPDDAARFALAGIAARRLAHGVGRAVVGDPADGDAAARRLLAQWLRDGVPREAEAARVDESVGTDTSNIVVMDAAGNAVSLIQSVSAPYGAGVVVPGTGVLLNNRMGGFGAGANAPAAGRRPANTLAPILVMKAGAPLAAVGTPGAPGQTCVLAQVLARALAGGEDIAEAVAAPRWSVDLQGRLVVEATMPAEPRARIAAEAGELRAMPEGWQTFGSVKVAMRRGAALAAIADQRRCALALAA